MPPLTLFSGRSRCMTSMALTGFRARRNMALSSPATRTSPQMQPTTAKSTAPLHWRTSSWNSIARSSPSSPSPPSTPPPLAHTHRTVLGYCGFAIRQVCARYRALGLEDPLVDRSNMAANSRRGMAIFNVDLPSMDSSFLELKVWACNMQVLVDHVDRFHAYVEKVLRRCSVWDRSYAAVILFRNDITAPFIQNPSASAAGVHDRSFSNSTAPTLDTTGSGSSAGRDNSSTPVLNAVTYTASVITAPTNVRPHRGSTDSDGDGRHSTLRRRDMYRWRSDSDA
ncbi:hypothetical protein B0H17DRAFT_1139974 [Mycena rosella]|uniref:Uncharacterized protein n=1 Tax=Mycena rosella TaxID=1033263 RepID=A0AAD7D2V1_MYCRO|nr:hypothetical protein B0H17DRAFT_1139974 [Mycena rosella]